MPGSFDVVSPATGEKIETFELLSEQDVLEVARRASDAFETNWSRLSLGERADYLGKLAKSLRAKKSDYANIMTQEMGKPITQAESEIEKCAWTAEVYSKKASEWVRTDYAETDAKESYVIEQPLGVVLSVMPWNFPFWQVIRFAVPALLMGNTSILRHSNVCPGSALAIEESFKNAGFPEGVFTTIITDHEAVATLVASDFVRGVSLTGSVEAGRRIGELAGKNLKKCVLELGGSDPFIVLEDSNVEQAAKVGVEARLLNSGQSCICAKRFIVADDIAKEFTEQFVSEMERRKTGNPLDRNTDVGPLVNKGAVRTIEDQVADAVRNGAHVELGGKTRDSPGSFYEPTVLTGIKEGMRAMREEVFGPVAPIFTFSEEKEAIRIANNSEFGLGASLWTESNEKASLYSRRIQSGMVFVNALVKSDPRIPFGGIKNSGIGRELGKYGLQEFVNVKTINIYETPKQKQTVAVSKVVE
jgi:succinate-semialdehyde dehydrogenase / glutarate-semialdehyde dehydrogenase